jgi:hypothetical protein
MDLIEGPVFSFAGTSLGIFNLIIVDATITDNESMRDANQFGIGEFHPGSLIVTVIEKDFDAIVKQRLVYCVCGLSHCL